MDYIDFHGLREWKFCLFQGHLQQMVLLAGEAGCGNHGNHDTFNWAHQWNSNCSFTTIILIFYKCLSVHLIPGKSMLPWNTFAVNVSKRQKLPKKKKKNTNFHKSTQKSNNDKLSTLAARPFQHGAAFVPQRTSFWSVCDSSRQYLVSIYSVYDVCSITSNVY